MSRHGGIRCEQAFTAERGVSMADSSAEMRMAAFDFETECAAKEADTQAKMEEYARDNISYWSKRSFSFSKNRQEELATDQHAVWSRTLDERIVAHFPGRSREKIKVLDIGTGPGFFAILLSELGYQVTATDYTKAMLVQARYNAGELAKNIRFFQMDAQDLSFSDFSFDVIVSRNLTWNLREPEQAYAEWCRVLKPGGLLLNFDANWYRYLYDETALSGHLNDRENVCRSDVEDDRAGTDIDSMESIALRAPLSMQHRPQWDLNILEKYGMRAVADPDIWKSVWTKKELINNASTPMFLIWAYKRKPR